MSSIGSAYCILLKRLGKNHKLKQNREYLLLTTESRQAHLRNTMLTIGKGPGRDLKQRHMRS